MKKHFYTIIICLFTISGYSFELPVKTPVIYTPKYVNNQANTIMLHTGFGQAKLTDVSILDSLRDKKIYKVDLVYTTYKEIVDFDQEELNQNRISFLNKCLPQLKEDNPTWSIIEQTGAIEKPQASTFFHGFVIHFGDPIDYKSQESFFEHIQTPFSSIDIDNRVGGRVKYFTGSVINMEKYAVTYKNGDAVEGFYQLQYREFRNQAEIALSGIPMIYSKADEEIFNSVGMYEIRATKDGEELKLQKDALVHFQCTEVLPDVAFYKMNDSGIWNYEKDIAFSEGIDNFVSQNGGMRMKMDLIKSKGNKRIALQKCNNLGEIDQGGFQGYSRIGIGEASNLNLLLAELNERAYFRYQKLTEEGDSIMMRTKPKNQKFDQHFIVVPSDDATEFVERITEMSLNELEITKVQHVIVYKSPKLGKDEKLVNVLGDEPIPASPGLVMGLESAEFGVYNCDQTRRIMDPVALAPTYYDNSTGIRLENLYVTCVIDLEMNASMSYHPNHLVANERGNTKLLVFTESKQLYFLDQDEFKELDLSQKEIRLDVTNITANVNNSDDLQAMLDL